MKIYPLEQDGNGKACVTIDMWNDEKFYDNPFAWDILKMMDEILKDVKFFKDNNIHENKNGYQNGTRMYHISHDIYNSDPDILGYFESAFNQAYDHFMQKTTIARRDQTILELKEKIE